MADLKAYFQQEDKFAKYVGIELTEISEGYAKATLTIEESHLNGLNIVHGAAIFALADLAFAAAANSYGTVAMAINVHISYVKAVREGKLIAEAKEVSLNPKLGTYDVSVKTETGELVASFQGMAYRKKEAIRR